MQTSESLTKIAPALLAAQKAIEGAHKSAFNPFHKSNYADMEDVIDAVKKPLNDNNIVYTQLVQISEMGAYVETVLLHTSGEYITSDTPVLLKDPNNPQAQGTGITYAKRYGLQAICGLPTEDDDGNTAAKPAKKPVKPPKKPAKPAKPAEEPTSEATKKLAREELAKLIKVNKISEKQIDSWKKFFKVKSLDDLKYEYVEKIIEKIIEECGIEEPK